MTGTLGKAEYENPVRTGSGHDICETGALEGVFDGLCVGPQQMNDFQMASEVEEKLAFPFPLRYPYGHLHDTEALG